MGAASANAQVEDGMPFQPDKGRMSRDETHVVVGLSGGVDSSLAAALLVERGFKVTGVCFRFGRAGAEPDPGVESARLVCARLGIDFVEVPISELFHRVVIQPFVEAYRAGLTPNPCVVCNRLVKFRLLTAIADARNAAWVATGHYAQISRTSGRFLLKRGADPTRDQSYFLFELSQAHLARTLFPIGGLRKDDVRAEATRRNLPSAARQESRDICFVPGRDYGRFLVESGFVTPHQGEIVDSSGTVLGFHDGIEFFTIGQRRGLRVPARKRLYVIDLDPEQNRVVVGDATELCVQSFVVERCNWIAFEAPPAQFDAVVKIRYNHPGVRAVVRPAADGTAQVELTQPQRAVTPGQAAVFYKDELVLGGGWILRHRRPGLDPVRIPVS